MKYIETPFSDLIGEILESVEISEDKSRIIFTSNYGMKWVMYHHEECCETVEIEDIVGDLSDIIGSPILTAAEVVSTVGGENPAKEENAESFTWTFYKLATVKGYVDIRWFGESNGYYSETVNFSVIKEQQ